MDSLYLGYRDPLFSLIIFFVLIFIITFVSYWWGRYKRKEDHKHLDKFVKQFHTLPATTDLKAMVASEMISDRLCLLLASSYTKNGDYEKSIEIYQEMLQKADKHNTKELLYLLGKTYYKAGFLERSKEVLLNLLSRYPRTPQALHYLVLIYESMREYRLALEVLEPLEALGEDVKLEKSYLESLIIMQDIKMPQEQKVAKLLQVYEQNHTFFGMVFEYLLRVDLKEGWRFFNRTYAKGVADLLWGLEKKDLDLDIIAKEKFLQDLYTAKGFCASVSQSDIFEFDILIKLEKRVDATLSFSYVCSSCKGEYPFRFYRCHHCQALDTMQVHWDLVKNYTRGFSEENNSFQ
jgi:pentatricopeptide repeat protein